jgi:hypothetical protein
LARTGLSSNVEDLKHFLLACPAYDDLRAVYPAFPADVYTTLSNPGCVAAVMGHSAMGRVSVMGRVPRLHWQTHCFI